MRPNGFHGIASVHEDPSLTWASPRGRKDPTGSCVYKDNNIPRFIPHCVTFNNYTYTKEIKSSERCLTNMSQNKNEKIEWRNLRSMRQRR